MALQGIFPVPIFRTTFKRDFTNKELKFIHSHHKTCYQNVGNLTSNNNYILEEPELVDIKQNILQKVNEYINEVYCPKYPIIPYITQSWINYTKKGEFHHRHRHANSIVSGSIYINAEDGKDKINFFKSEYQHIHIATNIYNLYNSEKWWIPIKSKDIVLFPSSLEHDVEIVKSNNIRISIAFNVIIKGTLGEKQSLTEYINH